MSPGILKLFRLIVISIFFALSLNAEELKDFDIFKKGKKNNNTLLIIGGIQGDEPGGFISASLIVTHYEITKGSVWVVPNLNFDSIIARSRGRFGDMNRKFSKLSKKDPDYKNVRGIKDLILEKDVKLIVNLHDGSGFYRKKYIDKDHSPYRWGQSSIIDQKSIDVEKYGNLYEISKEVCDAINSKLLKKDHSYLVRNTQTKDGDIEMERSLTYFVINKGKAAFANEASKSLNVQERTYYHLLALEKYMDIMGIEYKRKFKLDIKNLKHVINNDISISFYNNKINLPLSKIRKVVNYFPLNKNEIMDFKASNPLMTIIKKNNSYTIHYGNRRISRLIPDYFEMFNIKENIKVEIDGILQEVKIGSLLKVSENFFIYPNNDLRVNVIGFSKKNRRNEAGLYISKKQIVKRFSLDKNGKIYRIEFYKGKKFAGMLLVKFDKKVNLVSKSNELVKNKI